MKKKPVFYLMQAVTWPMQFFPLEFHYIFSDILFFFICYVFRYRRKVVIENLTNSFPEKSAKEINTIARKFYLNFTDMFIETLYLMHVDEDRGKKRIVLKNPEVIEDLLKQKRSIICVTGHLMNWEFPMIFSRMLNDEVYFVYKKLNNTAFDQFYKTLRSRFGAIPLEMHETARVLMDKKKSNDTFIALFVGDQRPQKHEIRFWMPFLNQDTPVFLGTEKIAIKTNSIVLYCGVQKIKRGYFEVDLCLITETPKETAEFEITQKHIQLLEQTINKYPDNWLWTHKRWKHKR